MEFRAIAAGFLLVLSTAAGGEAATVSFTVRNSAANTAGGRRFDTILGRDYIRNVLEEATSLVWSLFHQTSAADRKAVDAIELVVVDGRFPGGCRASPSQTGRIELNAQYIGNYAGDIRAKVTGMLYRETARVWQWDGGGRANPSLVHGIADWVRLRAEYAPERWVKPGEGSRWDERYRGVTAQFLDYLERRRTGFVAELNKGLKKATTGEQIFRSITGESVQTLWLEYKAAYAGA
ncbi:hypothetical protein ACP70R_023226 [Stipagrostis hirtigluma subsp. patula]